MQERQSAKAEETRSRILEQALELFRKKGFEKTTMREIAAAAGVATGAAYYYFRSKEDLVMAFYIRTSEEARPDQEAAITATHDLRKRLRRLIELKVDQFRDDRELLTALLKAGVDPRDPLSPFGEETREIREENIALLAAALEGASQKIPRDLAPHLPRLLWLYQMAIVYYWIIDQSPGQRKTARLTEVSLTLILQLLRVASLPLMGPVRKRVLELIRAIDEPEE